MTDQSHSNNDPAVSDGREFTHLHSRAMLLTEVIRILEDAAEEGAYSEEERISFLALLGVARREREEAEERLRNVSTFDWLASAIEAAFCPSENVFVRTDLVSGIREILHKSCDKRVSQQR